MKEMLNLLETLDWAQKRFKIVKLFQWAHNADYKNTLSFFTKKKNLKISWRLSLRTFLPHHFYFKLIEYIKIFYNKKKILKKLYNFFLLYNGIYRKTFRYMQSLRLFFYGKLMKRNSVLKFIFTQQQIFFQLFTNDTCKPDTHTTVGVLIRIRENIRDHGGKYVYRIEDDIQGAAIERHKDKKHQKYFRRTKNIDNFRYVVTKKKLVNPSLRETREMKIKKAKKEIFLKSLRKKNKDVENIVILNRRGNPKTESYVGKCQRRRFSTWLWFIKCIGMYLKKKNINILPNIILSITGLIKIHKQILKYIMYTFKKHKITAFVLNLNLKYRGAKLKHFSTIKKKTRKRIIKIEHSFYFK